MTVHLPDKKQMSIYDAAMQYQKEGVPLIVIAGKGTAPVRPATGRPRGRGSSASKRQLPRALSVFTGAT